MVEKYAAHSARADFGNKRDGVRRANERFVEKHRAELERLSWYRFTLDWLPLKHDVLTRRWGSAALRAARLLAAHPVKMMTRVCWTAPNLRRYRFRLPSDQERRERPSAGR